VNIKRRLAVYSAAAVMAAGVVVALTPTAASAHGATMVPGSRTWFCYQDGLRPNGEIIAFNPACASAIAQSGTTPLYNWFAVLRSDANGRTTGFIPDGQLCSGGFGGPYDFRAYNQARTDWPLTHLTSGATIQFRHSNWARHPGTFFLSITRQGWNPANPLAWSDLQEFWSVTDPPDTGPPGTLNYYFWHAQLPTGRSGRAIIYIRWVRSDSQENFFSCSDVVFDGGNGEVTGVGPNQTNPPPPPTSPVPPPPTTTPAPPPPPPPTTTAPPPPTGACSATFSVVNSWNVGFQGAITVRAGTSNIGSWTVRWTNPAGQAVTQLWNGNHTASGQNSTVTNAPWNGAIPANGTQSFGFLASRTGTGTPTVNNLTCTSP